MRRHRNDTIRRFGKVQVILGAVLLAALTVGGPTRTARGAADENAAATEGKIHADLAKEHSRANATGKLLLVDFYGAWCPWCIRMDKTLEDPKVKALLSEKFHYYKLDVGRFERHKECLQKYEVKGIPHITVFNKDGSVRVSEGGYKKPDAFVAFLKQAEAGQLTDIHPDLEEELHKANAMKKLLLVDFYGAWCPWCVRMDKTFEDPKVKALLAEKFHYYKLDVGRFARNNECLTHYKIRGIPHVIVFNRDGTVRESQAGYVVPDVFVAFLKEAESERPTGIHPDLESHLAKANAAGKILLVDFYGAWCPWCIRMDKTLEDPKVKALLSEKFLYVKLDVGRFERHKECLAHYKVRGIPHIAAFNKDGSVRESASGYKAPDAFVSFLNQVSAP